MPERIKCRSKKRLDAPGQVDIASGIQRKIDWGVRAMDISAQALTTCEVATDGGAISLGFVDSAGNPATITLSLMQVGVLVMTLPRLLDEALRARYGDLSLRYAYPLASWIVEQSTDTAQRIVTLQTEDGFSVCFSVPREQQSPLGEALMAQPKSNVRLRAN
jgi:hypothetical protein